ncbi:MAG: HupE/UreJ family protein [Planctomycetota bacterium]
MTLSRRTLLVLAGMSLGVPAVAWAHPGVASAAAPHGGLFAGLLHPLLGWDHVLAMVTVGLWAAQIGRRALWIVPTSFVVMMSAGASLGMGEAPLPFVESGILTSLMVLGLVTALAWRVPIAAAAVGVGVFALFHGHAHGSELVGGMSGLGYGLGFSLTTAALHATGIGLTLLLTRLRHADWVRYAGATVCSIGLIAGIAA